MKESAIQYRIMLFLFIILCGGAVSAQKLPAIQQGNQWLPDNMRVDGRFSEWKDSLQAYNRNNHIFYTIANDDKNLYLAISSTDQVTVGKIMAGGISFTINPAGTKKANMGPTVVFPLARTDKSTPIMDFLDSTKIHPMILGIKEIKVRRFKDINDSLLFIANDQGIKARMNYRHQRLAYELIVPLNLLGIDGSKPDFSYHIKLNGLVVRLTERSAPGLITTVSVPVSPSPASAPAGSVVAKILEMENTTDLWGRYTLAVRK